MSYQRLYSFLEFSSGSQISRRKPRLLKKEITMKNATLKYYVMLHVLDIDLKTPSDMSMQLRKSDIGNKK